MDSRLNPDTIADRIRLCREELRALKRLYATAVALQKADSARAARQAATDPRREAADAR
jgi:hypothetical protein